MRILKMTKKQNFTLSLPYLLSQFSILRSAKCLWNNGRCLFWSGLLLVVGFELTEQKIKPRLFQEYALRPVFNFQGWSVV